MVSTMADVLSDQPTRKNEAERQPPDSSFPSARKTAIRTLFDRLAPQHKKWVNRNAYYSHLMGERLESRKIPCLLIEPAFFVPYP